MPVKSSKAFHVLEHLAAEFIAAFEEDKGTTWTDVDAFKRKDILATARRRSSRSWAPAT